MSSIRLLFVDHAPALGGAQRTLLSLFAHLPRDIWQLHLACVDGQLKEAAVELDVYTHKVPFPRLRRSAHFPFDLVSVARRLTTLSREIGARAFYPNTLRAALYTALASVPARLPLIWHTQDFWLSESAPTRVTVDRAGKQFLVHMATRVITCSHAVQRHLPSSPKVAVVHNGIEIEQFTQYKVDNSFRIENEIPVDAPLIGMVGRLRPWKGQARFLHVAAKLLENYPDAHFVVIGGSPFGVEDDYPQMLTRLTSELGLSERVKFSGHLEDVRPALAALDVFVHPGDPEPFGLVNVEAMSMRKPVVAFAHGALPEIVEDGVNGILVEPGNEVEMAQAIASLLDNPQRREKMGNAGRMRTLRFFNAERMVTEIDGILREIVS